MNGAHEALEVLRAEHDAVRRALSELDALLAAHDGPEARAALERLGEFLAGDLERHLAREEEVLFPVLERYIGREGGPIQVMLFEHGELRRLGPRFREAAGSAPWPEVTALGRSLAGLLAEHVHKEDFVLFPLSTRILSPAELAEVARGLAAGAAPSA